MNGSTVWWRPSVGGKRGPGPPPLNPALWKMPPQARKYACTYIHMHGWVKNTMPLAAHRMGGESITIQPDWALNASNCW